MMMPFMPGQPMPGMFMPQQNYPGSNGSEGERK